MTWRAIYELATGKLVSSGTIVADPLPDGLAAKELPGDPAGQVWDEVALEFKTSPKQTVFSSEEFMDWFTVEEEAKIRDLARTNGLMATFLARAERKPTIDI